MEGDLRSSDESIEVKWFSKEEALKVVNPKQQLRFRRALNYQAGFSCLGYQVNSSDEIELHEEYLFDR